MSLPFAKLLRPRQGSRIVRPDACIATLPTTSGRGQFLILPDNTLLVWWEKGGAQIWSGEGLIASRLEEETDPPIKSAALLEDGRFWTASESEIKIYRLGGELVTHLRSDYPLRGIDFIEGKRIIIVSAFEVCIHSLAGEPPVKMRSSEDMGYDFGRAYLADTIILFRTRDRKRPEAVARALIDDTDTGERYSIDLYSNDLNVLVASVDLPHNQRLTKVLLHNKTLFTLSDDCMRMWGPALKLYPDALHTDGNFAADVFSLSNREYVSRDGAKVALFSAGGGEFELMRGWDFGYIFAFERISDRRALVAGSDGLAALIEFEPPFGVKVIQDTLEPTSADVANVAGSAAFLPRSRRIVTYDSDGGIAIWDADGEPVSKRTRYSMSWWDGARELPDGRILMWDTDCRFLILAPDGQIDGDEIDRFLSKDNALGQIRDVGVFPDGTIAMSVKGTISLFHPIGASVASPSFGHNYGILDAIELKDGGFITAGVDDRLISWDEQAVPRALLDGHEDCVNGALEMAGGQIVSWSDDGTVRLWNRDGRPAGLPLLAHGKPIVKAKILNKDHVVVSDGAELFCLSIGAKGNPRAVQRSHRQRIIDFVVLSSGNVLSHDLSGRLFEWDPFGTRLFGPPCAELKADGFCAFDVRESPDGSVLAHGSAMSPLEIESLPEPVRESRCEDLPSKLVAWRAGKLGKRHAKSIFEGELKDWIHLGGDTSLAVLPGGEAKLFRFDGTGLGTLATLRGTLGAVPLFDGRALLFMGSGGWPGHDVVNPDDPQEQQIIVAGRTKIELSHNVVLDAATGSSVAIKSIGRAHAAVGLPGGGLAALYPNEERVRTFGPDGSALSHHRFLGRVHFFGRRPDGNVGLLTFHGGQLLVYDLMEGGLEPKCHFG